MGQNFIIVIVTLLRKINIRTCIGYQLPPQVQRDKGQLRIFFLQYNNISIISGMCANSVWLLQRALPVILLTTIPQFTQCNSEVDRNRLLSLLEARTRRAPFNSWAGKRSSEEYGSDVSDLGRLEGLQHFYLQQLHDAQLANDLEKRAPFNSWAGKRAPFNSWAGKRAPFNSWAGKRAPFNSWAGKRSSEESNELLNHGDDRFGDSPHR